MSALLAQAAGLVVHYQHGKRAFEPRWSTSPPKIAEELRQDYRDGYNIGFRTGNWSNKHVGHRNPFARNYQSRYRPSIEWKNIRGWWFGKWDDTIDYNLCA